MFCCIYTINPSIIKVAQGEGDEGEAMSLLTITVARDGFLICIVINQGFYDFSKKKPQNKQTEIIHQRQE